MMGAVQPFISGAISKTINMPTDVSVDEIMHAYTESWKLGLKAVAIYRDGSKRTQPLNTSKDKEEKKVAAVEGKESRPLRRKLPDERRSFTHKFDIAGHEGYITAGMYEDGQPGEIFITMSKEGSTISGLMDSFATAISMALQYGVPLRVLVDKFSHMRFEPSGFTKNPDIPMAKSIMDYIFRWLAIKFLDGDAQQEVGIIRQESEETNKENNTGKKVISISRTSTAGRSARDQHQQRDESLSAGCAALPRLRCHHDSERRLLQVHELRGREWLLVKRG